MESHSVPYARLAPRPLKPEVLGLVGITRRQIEEHYALYEGYVAKLNEIHEKLLPADRGTGGPIYSELRELKVELSFALDAVKLHEAYFENLGGAGGEPSGQIRQLVERDFGSAAEWRVDFHASGMCARGWVILAYDLDDRRLHNFIADDHNSYGIWNAVPILVLDAYEHAYAIDYGVQQALYLAAFLRNVDWAIVNRRLAQIGK